MSLLIDGYNLLHASGILARGVGPGTLERARGALLNFLAESLTPEEISHTTVVFDATHAPKGLQRTSEHRGLSVRFASPGGEADDEIELLIRQDSAPRKLIVVSSDHRLQRAARRRKATAIDSDRWYGEILRRRLQQAEPPTQERPKADAPLTDDAVAYWLKAFGDGTSDSGAQPNKAAKDRTEINPFPPGYAEDIADEDVS
jgi:uncharacterized protein